MELIERYIYSVTKRMPESQRVEAGEELRVLIDNKLIERVQDRPADKQDVEGMLLELGHPRIMAEKYSGKKRYLIGPELYDVYILVLKIVLLVLSVIVFIQFIIQVIIEPTEIIDHIVDLIVSIMASVIPMTLGWTTVGFAIAAYVGAGKSMEKDWKPADLPQLPDSKKQIKKWEPVVAISVYVALFGLLIFAKDYLGIWMIESNQSSVIIPFFNEATYTLFLPLMLGVILLFIIRESAKLKFQQWTLSLAIITAVINVIGIAVIVFVMLSGKLWNPNFMGELIQSGVVNESGKNFELVTELWNKGTVGVMILFAVGLFWDSIIGFVRARKVK